MTRSGDLPPALRVDPALVLNDPDVLAVPLTHLSLTGTKVAVSTTLALRVARKYYPDVSSSDLDAAIAATGGDRLEELNLDVWPAVKRWLNSEPKGQNHMYVVPLSAVTVGAAARRVNPSDLVRGLVAGAAVGVLVVAFGLSGTLAVLAGALWAGFVAFRRWNSRNIFAERKATHHSRLEHHHLEPRKGNAPAA